jgi:hypothetical protein
MIYPLKQDIHGKSLIITGNWTKLKHCEPSKYKLSTTAAPGTIPVSVRIKVQSKISDHT